jgi:ParB/RepB/Spo0J family partition protein
MAKPRPKPTRRTARRPSRRPAPAPHIPDLPPGTPDILPLAAIRRSPFNKRRRRPGDPADGELTASIRAVGVLEPLLVRPLPDGAYELLAGERRWRCAQAAGLAEVPVVIHQADDKTACLLLFAENFHRRDLHFLEEAETVAEMLRAGWTHEQIAGQVDHAASWVARRARLCSLDEQIRAWIDDPEHPLSAWTVAHFEELALVDPATQLQVVHHHSHYLEHLSPADLRRAIADLTHDLAQAPWKLDDEALVPDAGACSACPFRTSREPLLFPDEDAGDEDSGPRRSRKAGADRCLRPDCWRQKTEALLARKQAELAARHPGAIRVNTTGRGGAVPEWRTTRANRKTPGAVPALVVDGPQVGSVRWVTLPQPLPADSRPAVETSAGPRRSTLAERRRRLGARRRLRAIEGLVADLERATAVPSLAQVAALAAVFGTHQTNACGWYVHDPGLPPSLAQPASEPFYPRAFEYGAVDPAVLAGALWKRVLPVLLARLKTNDQVADAERAFAEARHLARLCGLDAGEYLARATAELPDPKSWEKEEAALRAAGAEVPEDLAGDQAPSEGEAVWCPSCGGPLPPGRPLCEACDDGDLNAELGEDETTALVPHLGPLDAEELHY